MNIFKENDENKQKNPNPISFTSLFSNGPSIKIPKSNDDFARLPLVQLNPLNTTTALKF